MYDEYHAKGLEIWGLSVEGNDNQPDGFFNQFAENNGLHYPISLASSDTIKVYKINSLPTAFLIDKSGRIALSFIGEHPEKDFKDSIKKLLAE
jgi:glutathione peroxidase-family protein